MGTEAVWVPIVAAAVAGTTTYVNNRNMAKRQDNELAAQLMRSSAKQKQADAKVNEAIAKTGASTGESERGTVLSQYLSQLNRAKGATMGGLTDMPAANDAYRRDAANAALGLEETGKNRAELFSTLDAALLQRQNEAELRRDTGSDLDVLAGDVAADDYLTRLRLRGIRPNPYLSAIGSAASAFGGAYSGGAAGGAASALGSSAGGSGWGGGADDWAAIARAGRTA